MPVRWSVFLDRDGVLNRKAPDNDYIKTWAEFAWLPGVLDALRKLTAAGARLLVVTNQRGVARGLIGPADLDDIHEKLRAEAARVGATIDGIYVCPHLEGTCECRKPGVKLFHDAQRDFPDIVFARSFVVGDTPSDIEAGRKLGARTILIAAGGDAASLPDAVDRLMLPVLMVSGKP